MTQTTITLSQPITVQGADITTLTLRTPTVGDMEVAMEHKDNELSLVIHLLARISNHTTDDIRQIALPDMKDIQTEMEQWLNF